MRCFGCVIILLSIFHRTYCQCSIDIRTELNRTSSGSVKEPLFLKYSSNEYKLMIPDAGELKFQKAGETAFIACTSDQKPNYLTLNNKTSSTIICASGNTFNINNKKLNVIEFNECHSQISGSAVNKNQPCGGNGTQINIGFQLSDGRGFIKLIDVCYNKKVSSLIYTRHVIQGKTIKQAMKSNTRPSGFKTSEMSTNVSAQNSYTKARQLKRFEEIFASKEKAEGFLEKTYLARGHSSPDGDFIFVSWQIATYYYINSMPQWQSINNANWKHIESALRTKAGQLKVDCVIFTGGIDVLKLDNKKISLEPNGLAVPKWTWKIINVPTEQSGIAFITYNNPFATSAPNSLCQDICDEYGWNWKDRKTFSKGYTICCKVSDLMNINPAIPQEATVDSVLTK